MAAIAGRAYERKIEILNCSGYFVYEVKICQNLDQRKKVKIFMCSDTLNGKNFLKKYVLHCNGIEPFVRLMGNFNWGPISRNDIVSNARPTKAQMSMRIRSV